MHRHPEQLLDNFVWQPFDGHMACLICLIDFDVWLGDGQAMRLVGV